MSKRVTYPDAQYPMGIRGRSTVQWMLTPAFLFELSILQVLVDDHTCNVQEISTFMILHRTLGYYFLPLADLAVDWINDNLYWTDRDYKLIEEYNLRTFHRRVVVHTGLLSHPLGIAVYPYPGYGYECLLQFVLCYYSVAVLELLC